MLRREKNEECNGVNLIVNRCTARVQIYSKNALYVSADSMDFFLWIIMMRMNFVGKGIVMD